MKDLWIETYDKIFDQAVESGMDGVDADIYASEQTEKVFPSVIASVVDRADYMGLFDTDNLLDLDI